MAKAVRVVVDEITDKEEVLKLFDIDVEDYSRFMAQLEDQRARGALSNPEKALIKTFLVQKYRGRF